MADPATVKLIITAVTKVTKTVTDPESRQKLLYALFGGLAGLVVIILIPIYLLTHPLEMLKVIFGGSPDIVTVEEFKLENDEKVLIIDGDLLWNEGAEYPMPLNGTVTCEYGVRNDPFGGSSTEFHRGMDIQGAWHANVIAITAGVIEKTSTVESGYGNTILIKHTKTDGTTFYSFYAHLSKIYVFEGQSVNLGTVIGLEGGDPDNDPNPGRTTGHHLHFEIRAPGPSDTVDPTVYVYKQETETNESEGTST